MGSKLSEDDFIFMSLEEVLDPPEGLVYHYKNCYWVVHPTKGLAFLNRASPYRDLSNYSSPQCALSETLLRTHATRTISFDYEIVKLMSVLVPQVRGCDC